MYPVPACPHLPRIVVPGIKINMHVLPAEVNRLRVILLGKHFIYQVLGTPVYTQVIVKFIAYQTCDGPLSSMPAAALKYHMNIFGLVQTHFIS